jgi:AraC-like DNA-binding protein
VTEISEACGFATPSQLATSFRQEYGMSPTDFRRRRP